MKRRSWTPAEDAAMAMFGKVTAKQLAVELGRTESAIYQRANTLGITQRRDPALMKSRQSRLLELHAAGWSDAEIGAELGVGREAVKERRARMGLAANGRNERYRKRVAANTRRQCEAAGVANLAELRSKRFRELARNLGWPTHLSLRATQILETLYRRGPMTRRQIVAAIGMPWKGSRKTLGNKRVPGQSYMAELQRAGLVVRLESAIVRKGKGNHQDLYMVALGVEPCRNSRQLPV